MGQRLDEVTEGGGIGMGIGMGGVSPTNVKKRGSVLVPMKSREFGLSPDVKKSQDSNKSVSPDKIQIK